MEERPEQRPEGALIAAALKRSRTSQRKAAARVGISENRFRAIVHGYQTVSAGTYAPVRGPAETVARMAHVVGVTPEQLEEAGRADAADELRTILDAFGEPPGAEKRRGLFRNPVMDEAESLMDENERMAADIVRRWRRLDAEGKRTVADLIEWMERKTEERSQHGDQSR